MEAPSKACPCIGWAGEPPASSASATVLVGSGRWLLGYVWGHSCPPSYSLAYFQSWMVHLEMTLCLGWQSQLEKLFSRLTPEMRGEGQLGEQGQDALVFLVLGSSSFLWFVYSPGMVPSDAEPPQPELQPSRSGVVPSGPPDQTPACMGLSVPLRSTWMF